MSGVQDIDALAAAVQSQDRTHAFRRAIGHGRQKSPSPQRQHRASDTMEVVGHHQGFNIRPPGTAPPGLTRSPAVGGTSTTAVVGQHIVVFVADNEATKMALSLAMAFIRPGVDVLHLVTLVPSVVQEQAGKELLKRFEAVAIAGYFEIQCDVVVSSCRYGMIGHADVNDNEMDIKAWATGT